MNEIKIKGYQLLEITKKLTSLSTSDSVLSHAVSLKTYIATYSSKLVVNLHG